MTLLTLDHDARVLVIAPHPDDETLATGGLLQQAVAARSAVRVVFLTDGDNNPWPQRVLERRLRIDAAARRRFGMLRRLEATAALAQMGVAGADAAFWNFPDQGITDLLLAGDGVLIVRLAEEIRQWRPTVLVGPSRADLHPDHSAAAVLLDLALAGIPNPPPTRIDYLVHTRGERLVENATLDRSLSLALSPAQMAAKRQAIICHVSQLKLRPRSLLARARATEEYLLDAGALAVAADAVNSPSPVPRSPGPTASRSSHPIRAASANDGQLQFDLAPRACPGAFGRATLLIVTGSGGKVGRSLAVKLPRGILPGRRDLVIRDLAAPATAAAKVVAHPTPAADLANPATTPAEVAAHPTVSAEVAAPATAAAQAATRATAPAEVATKAQFTGRGSTGHLTMPLSALGPFDRLYAKIDRRHGFFDEAGWIEVTALIPS